MSFNPHTHAGCDKDSTYNFEQAFDVSIHTPTQGVTKLDISNVPTENVSIHTPTQGVTLDQAAVAALEAGFNPHTHAGCDKQLDKETRNLLVSIHTPTQGVTFCSTMITRVLLCFNPHTHAGCDGAIGKTDRRNRRFQSTHPRRV